MAIEGEVKSPSKDEVKEARGPFFEGSDDIPGEPRQAPALQRKLKSRHLQMIAIGKPRLQLDSASSFTHSLTTSQVVQLVRVYLLEAEQLWPMLDLLVH